ncbi:MAG: hypothetical protein H7287_05215 [Thermoleophilia bacterium]|nr:hypothetical protein [Thermoleophilia bacterium]
MQHTRSNAERLDPRRRTRSYVRTHPRVSVIALSLPQLRLALQALLARIAAR